MPLTSPSTSSLGGPRGPGRPRNQELDQQIIDATLGIIKNNANVTVDAVVKASGVSRASVYRRWSSITHLIAAALDSGRALPSVDITGPVKDALADMMFNRTEESQGEYSEEIFRKRMQLVMGDRELQQAYWETHAAKRRKALEDALELARDRGEIREDTDIEAALDAIYGVFYYQIVVRGESITGETKQRCLKAFKLIWKGLE